MELLYPRCCGIDIHKKIIVACLIILDANGQRKKEIRTFRTVTSELLRCLDWLKAADCTHAAMESTGVYWKPIYNLFEGHLELLLVNAQHIKAVPGRKTDVKDAEWIADLLQHGLLKGSYIPPAPQREMRELTRYRVSLVEERARAVNRLQKTLEDTNIKLGDVATDIMGKSARAMLEALLAGQTDPATLADLARGKLKSKRAQLEEALVGTVKSHHRFMLGEQLVLIDTLDEAITRVSEEIEARFHPPTSPGPDAGKGREEPEAHQKQDSQMASSEINPPHSDQEQKTEPDPGWEVRNERQEENRREEPEAHQKQDHQMASSETNPPHSDQEQRTEPLSWQEAVTLLDTIPGINRRAAEGILAEIGIDMSRFKSAGHLASWAGMCPGSHESAGKRLSGKTNKGSPWLRRLLVEAAHAAAHSKNTYLSALYHRLKGRGGGAKQAMVAVGHKILVTIYHLLDHRQKYQDLGGNYFDEHDKQAVEKRLVRRLEKLGYQVLLEPETPVA